MERVDEFMCQRFRCGKRRLFGEPRNVLGEEWFAAVHLGVGWSVSHLEDGDGMN